MSIAFPKNGIFAWSRLSNGLKLLTKSDLHRSRESF
jgi:hypothetical protein